MVTAEFGAEVILNEPDLVRQGLNGNGIVGRRRREDQSRSGDGALMLRLVGAVHAVLKQVEGHAESFQPQFFGQPEFAEAEEVFVEVFGEVAADKLLAAVVEGAYAVRAGVVA